MWVVVLLQLALDSVLTTLDVSSNLICGTDGGDMGGLSELVAIFKPKVSWTKELECCRLHYFIFSLESLGRTQESIFYLHLRARN
jgi:hypothetical protein